MRLGVLLLLVPLQERVPLLGPPDGIELEVGPVAFAIEELLALGVELPELLHGAALLLVLLPQLLVLLPQVEARVRAPGPPL